MILFRGNNKHYEAWGGKYTGLICLKICFGKRSFWGGEYALRETLAMCEIYWSTEWVFVKSLSHRGTERRSGKGIWRLGKMRVSEEERGRKKRQGWFWRANRINQTEIANRQGGNYWRGQENSWFGSISAFLHRTNQTQNSKGSVKENTQNIRLEISEGISHSTLRWERIEQLAGRSWGQCWGTGKGHRDGGYKSSVGTGRPTCPRDRTIKVWRKFEGKKGTNLWMDFDGLKYERYNWHILPSILPCI